MCAAGRLAAHLRCCLLFLQTIIAVPNAILMHNHQVELARHLEGLGHLFSCSPDKLVDTLHSSNWSKLRPYQPGDASGIVQHIDALVALRR